MREVDLVDLEKASTVFQAQVFNKGKVILYQEGLKKISFQSLVYKKYARLNEERECIIRKIEERGSLHD
jgi:hypothetical protein